MNRDVQKKLQVKKAVIFFFSSVVIFPGIIVANTPRIYSIDKVLRLARTNSPQISADRFRQISAQKSVKVALLNFAPVFETAAMDGSGFPGSAGELAVPGMTGSPFRDGFSSDLVAEQNIWDFGRTVNKVRVAKEKVALRKQDTRITAYEVEGLALQTYYECAFYRTQIGVWNTLQHESELIMQKAHEFVNTGQVDVVDGYLAEELDDESQTQKAFYEKDLKRSIIKMSVIIGVPANQFMCSKLPHQLTRSLNPNENMDESPILQRAVVSKKVAQDELKEARTDYYPRLVGIASYGEMERYPPLVQHNYAISMALIWPFGDFKTYGKIERARAERDASGADIAAKKQFLDEMDDRYDEIILSSRVRLVRLNTELLLSNQAFKVAKERYFSTQGDLVDLREAFRNLARINTDINKSRADYLEASGAKALLNGGDEKMHCLESPGFPAGCATKAMTIGYEQ